MQDFQVLDLDGDGDDDILDNTLRSLGAGLEIRWYRNDGDIFNKQFISDSLIINSGANNGTVVARAWTANALPDLFVNTSSDVKVIRLQQSSPLQFYSTQLHTLPDLDHFYGFPADFNHDGQPDMAGFTRELNGESRFLVLLSDGTDYIPVDLGLLFTSLPNVSGFHTEIIDMNGDDYEDLVFVATQIVGDGNDDAVIYARNQQNGTFEIFQAGLMDRLARRLPIDSRWHKLLSFSDDNNDGLTDVIFSGPVEDSHVAVKLQQISDAVFDRILLPTLSPVREQKMIVQDVDLDGLKDIVSVPHGSSNPTLNLFINNGTAYETPLALTTLMERPNDSALVRSQNETTWHVVASGNFFNTMYLQSSDLSFDQRILGNELVYFVHAVEPIDTDGQGDQELLVLSEHSSAIFLYSRHLNDGFIQHLVDAPEHQVIGVHALDYDQDGDEDVLAFLRISHGQLRVDVYENLGNHQFQASTLQTLEINTSTSTEILWFDMDNDGDSDAVFNFETGLMRWYEFDGNHFTQNRFFGQSIGTGISRHVLADLDGDGDTDFVQQGMICVVFICNNETNWYEMRPDKSHVKHLISDALSFLIVKSGDLDGDGADELILKNDEQDVYAGKLINGAMNFSPLSIHLEGENAYRKDYTVLGDVNGAGLADVVNRFNVYLNLGNGVFQLQRYAEVSGLDIYRMLDLNGDGRDEIFVNVNDFNGLKMISLRGGSEPVLVPTLSPIFRGILLVLLMAISGFIGSRKRSSGFEIKH